MILVTVRRSLLAIGLLLAVPALAGPPPASLEPILAEIAKDRMFSNSDVGFQVVDIRTGEEVFSRGAHDLLSPASTMKVLTAATALKELGPAYRFTTVISAMKRPKSGVVSGDLYVKGGGDPTLVVEKLWKMVYDLKLAGVDQIDGNVLFDEGFFDGDHSLTGWNKAADIKRGPSYFPALSALSLNFNTVALVVRPADRSGQKATATLETPAGSYVSVVNGVTTGSGSSRRAVSVERLVQADGTMQFTVGGSIPSGGSTARYYRTVDDPTAHFMGAFVHMLERNGIEMTGEAKLGIAPDAAVELVELRSAPLAAILMDMNKFSNNFMAEQVLRTVGAEVEEGPGSTASGLVVVQRYLESLGLDEAEFQLVNGSGLSREARLTPAALNAVLLDMAHDPTVGDEAVVVEASLGVRRQYRIRPEDVVLENPSPSPLLAAVGTPTPSPLAEIRGDAVELPPTHCHPERRVGVHRD